MNQLGRIGAITWRSFRLELDVDEACEPSELYTFDSGEDKEHIHVGVGKEPDGTWGGVIVLRGVEAEGAGPTWLEALDAAFEDLIDEYERLGEAITRLGKI